MPIASRNLKTSFGIVLAWEDNLALVYAIGINGALSSAGMVG